MKAVIYVRVSDDKQVRSGLGLEAQEAACRAHCARLGWGVLAIERDEGISGRDDLESRPGLQRAVDRAKLSPDVTIVVYSLSRFSRRQAFTWRMLDDRGIYRLQIASASESFENVTPAGRAMLGMIAVFAALESELVSERTKAALGAKKARGERLGPPRFAEGSPAQTADIRARYASGKYSLQTLADTLNREGVKAQHGGAWHKSTIARLCDAKVSGK